ncbi:MAG TPA: BamA/TamA family outer membrane protein [Candidatus Eisenbacteria bacterium]|nr:BamA/TamA family outer membrane protein [Candidatus Eisenbacteria bacterium]
MSSRTVASGRSLLLLFASLGFLSTSAVAKADDSVSVDPLVATVPGTDPTQSNEGGAGRTAGPSVTPLLAPIPFKNSQLGWGLVLMVGAIHRFDPDTTLKPSTGAVGGFYTENKSWGLMALEMARLGHDTWRLRGAASHMDVRYDFFGIGEDAGDAGISVPLEQTVDLGVGTVLRRIVPGLFGGAGVLYMHTDVDLRRDLPPALDSLDVDSGQADLFAVGLQGEYDTRNDDYWPTRGSLAVLKAWFFTDALGASSQFQRMLVGWSWYTRLRGERLLLATNVNAAAASDDAPSYLMPSLGAGRFGLRGYTQGRYRDQVMTTAQAEVRWHSRGRFGAVTFFGVGQVAPDLGGLGDASLLPAGGLGLRYRLTRQFPMHMRFDVAWGKNENLFYFSVAEAF